MTRAAGRGALERVLEPRQARRQHGVEPLFLAAHRADDVVLVGDELRIGVAHLADDDRHQRVEHRLGESELLSVPHRPAHDLAQHVAAPFVGRHDPVGDEKGHRAHVVGDDAHGDVGRIADARAVGPARLSPIASSSGVNRSVS